MSDFCFSKTAVAENEHIYPAINNVCDGYNTDMIRIASLH